MTAPGHASTLTEKQRLERREERRIAAPFRGMFATRIVVEFVLFGAAWTGVLVAGIVGAIPLWLGFVINTVLATTFYMPLHDATHGNIWGSNSRMRWGEDLIGVLSSVPLGFDYFSHRVDHMRHHAYTNDPLRDPDYATKGRMRELPIVWWGTVLGATLVPLLVFVPASRRLLPRKTMATMQAGGSEPPDRATIAAGKSTLRYWVISTAALVAAFALGFGPAALWLWWVPGKLAVFWLILVFAWYPHHPADQAGRYVDTRVAVFRGSTLLIRGHDHHALHHLFPRVPHYLLPALWQEIGPTLTPRGVRTEGRALGATGPIIW